MIKVVFLDIDDTLLSFSGYVKQSMREGFELFGLKPYTEDMYPVFEKINSGLWQSLERGELTFEELKKVRWNRIFEALGIDFDGERFEEYFREQLLTSAVPEEGAYRLLEYLSGKYVLCAASNGPYGQQLNRLLTAKMDKYFRHIFISSQVGAQKPSKEFFDYCFMELKKEYPDIEPSETVMIGDSMTSDMKGGADYGMHTVLYAKKQVSPENAAKVEHIVSALSGIEGIL